MGERIVAEYSGREFPREQVEKATRAVSDSWKTAFGSWNTAQAWIYRGRERIRQDLGTAVNICTMVSAISGRLLNGVCFTRAPASGRPGVYGDYLVNAQGEDVVAGISSTLSLEGLARIDPASHSELTRIMRRLETRYRDLCDFEMTVERGKLSMLQARVGKRTAPAAFCVATQLVDENLITPDEALARGTPCSPEEWRRHRVPRSARSSSTPPPRWHRRRAVKGAALPAEITPDDLEGMIDARRADQPRWQDLARRGGWPANGPDVRVRCLEALLPLHQADFALVGSVIELHLIRDEIDEVVAEVAARTGVPLAIPICTHDRAAAGRADRGADRRSGRVLPDGRGRCADPVTAEVLCGELGGGPGSCALLPRGGSRLRLLLARPRARRTARSGAGARPPTHGGAVNPPIGARIRED